MKKPLEQILAHHEVDGVTDVTTPLSEGSGLLDLLKRAAEASLVFAALLYAIG